MIRHNGIEIDRPNRRITFNGQSTVFQSYGHVIFKLVEHLLLVGPLGATREEIYEITHGHRADGGTEGGPKDAQIWMWQPHFKNHCTRLGVKLVRKRESGRTRYALRVV